MIYVGSSVNVTLYIFVNRLLLSYLKGLVFFLPLHLYKGERLQYDLTDIFVLFLSYKNFLNVFCFPKSLHGFFVRLMGYVDICRVCLRFLWLPQNITIIRKIVGTWHTNPPIVNKHRNAKINKSPKFCVILWYSDRGHYVMWNPDIESKIIPLLFFTIALEMFFSVVCPNFHVTWMSVKYITFVTVVFSIA